MKYGKARIAVPLAVMLLIGIAYVANVPVGNLSSFGWSWISTICPLGALSALLAEKAFIPHAVVAIVLFIVVSVVFGRAFCGWVCPVPVIEKLRPKKKAKGADAAEDLEAKEGAALSASALDSGANGRASGEVSACAASGCASGCSSCAEKRRQLLDSRHVILGGSLLTAALFGFPVFCLVCPIGLSFALLALIVNLFAEGDLTWGLVVVPAILLVEVVFFRKWCAKICPLSAAMSLAARAGKFLRPKVNKTACLETAGKTCGVCAKVCPQGIDPCHPSHGVDPCECTKCMACVEHCPSGAITLPLLAKVAPSDEAPAEEAKVG